MNKLALTVAAAILTAAFAAGATPDAPGPGASSPASTIYEWVDDSGVKHASDTVPEKYKGVASRVDPSRFRISTGEQQEAERQAVTLKAKAASVVSPSLPASSAARRSGESRDARLGADTAECAASRRQPAAHLPCVVYSNPDGTHGFYPCTNTVAPDSESVCGPQASH
jgi:Domain of unknown function (DUF4124)